MKYLLTRCPRCRAAFYVEVGEGQSVDVTCPYCRYQYGDTVRERYVKEGDYYWELYKGLYPHPKGDLGNRKFLKISGLLLLFTVPFFLFPMIYVFDITSLSNTLGGIGLASLIFLTFVIAGGLSSLKSYSFAISLTGSIFAILDSLLLGVVSSSPFIENTLNDVCMIFIVPLLISFIVLLLTIKNKRGFKRGY